MHENKNLLSASLTISLALVLFIQNGIAQPVYTYRLKAHTPIDNVPWKDSLYWFPNFQEGTMVMATGFAPDLKMKINYNLYWKRLEIINERNDTISLPNAQDVKLLNFNDRVFYNDKRHGYVEVCVPSMLSLGISCQLAVTMEMLNGKKFKADDYLTNTIARFDRIYYKEYSYFFIDSSSELVRATKSSLLKLMRTHQNETSAYLNEYPVNFKKQSDLIRLLNFCNSLLAIEQSN